MRKVLINDPIVNELAFDALFHLSQPEQRGKLTNKELRATKTAKKARHFAGQMTLDEKLVLFAKTRIGYTLEIHAIDWKRKEWYEKVKAMTKGQQVAEASKIKLVVVNDRIVVNNLNMMANLTHSDTYLLNMDFHRVGYFVNTWKDAVPDPDKLHEALDYAKMINKLALVQNMAMKAIRGLSDIGDLDLNILMYLYDAGAKYISRGTIDNYFGGIYKKTLITASMKRLIEKSLVERDPTVRAPQYQITSFGTTAVMEFHTKNLQAI